MTDRAIEIVERAIDAFGAPIYVRHEVVVDPRLSATPTVWYLAADSRQVDTIEVARLQGQRGVAIEEDHDFATGNFRLKAVLDFAAAPIDWRGLYRYAAS